MVPLWITHWTARTPRLSCFPFVRFILRLAVIVMICPAAVLAESCPITTTLAVTDAQQGVAGKTGTIWRVLPDCTFSVARFIDTSLAAPHRQGRLAPDQQTLLSNLIAKNDIAQLPARTGRVTAVNARTISVEYDGRVSVLGMGPGERDVDSIRSADPSDPRRRLLDLAAALQSMLGS